MKKIFYTTVFLLVATQKINTLLVTGDPEATTGETFSFDVGFAAFDIGSDQSAPRLWVANNDPAMSTKDDTVKPYGLSMIVQLASYVAPGIVPIATPMTNEEAATVFTFDGTTATATAINPNPLWGATFHLFNVAGQYPSFVLDGSKNSFYLVQDIQRYTTPTETKPNVTQLLRYDFAAGKDIRAIFSYGKTAFFTASATTNFGSPDSSITQLAVATQNGIPYLNVVANTPITVSTDALKGGASGNDLSAIGTSVNLNYTLQNFYIGLDVTANAAAGSCATALTYATLASNGSSYDFVYQEIAPASLLTTGIDTIVSAPVNSQVRIANTSGMLTSTGLTYLIVARDNGTDSQSIYALPIVATGSNMGQIADFSQIQNNFKQDPLRLTSRQFTTTVSNVDDINPAGPYVSQLQVGTIDLPLDTTNFIQQLYTVGDSVYIVIGDDYDGAGQQPGTFQSQAIFAEDGHIIAWTPWTRVLGSDKPMNYSFVDRKTLSGYYIAHETTNFRAVNQTTFVYNSNLAPLLSASPTSGIQGLFNFSNSTTGLTNCPLLISTGYGQIVAGQTGIISGGNLIINSPMTTTTFTSDTINQALVACEVASSGTNRWLFAGGTNGLVVLSNDNTGVSWTNNLANVAALNAGQTLKTVGSFTFIKKLFADNGFLYVLTNNGLYQIELDPNKFTLNPTVPLNPVLLLSSTDISNNTTYFLDVIVNNSLCIIGTTNGLYSFNLSNNSNLQKINIPNGLPAISKIIPITPSADSKDFYEVSNLIILNNTFGTQQARINRFTVQNGVITPFDDFLIANPKTKEGIASSFIKFDNYVSSYFTDGSWNIASSYFQGVNQPSNNPSPTVLQLHAGIHTGFSSSQMILPMFSSNAPLTFISGVNLSGYVNTDIAGNIIWSSINLAGFIRESTSGSVITYGSFLSHANA